MKRLVLFVEGPGDEEAVPILVKRIIGDGARWGTLHLDSAAFRIGGVARLAAPASDANWKNKLRAAIKRPNVGGILVVLDGDAKTWEGRPFCVAQVACTLVERAKEIGAGKIFSLAIVFACCEFETWLLAGVESLAGKLLRDGRPGVLAGTGTFDAAGNLEASPRDAKGVLGSMMPGGYKPTIDQAELTKLVDLNVVRRRNLKSFARLENAVNQLANACQTGDHAATPPSK